MLYTHVFLSENINSQNNVNVFLEWPKQNVYYCVVESIINSVVPFRLKYYKILCVCTWHNHVHNEMVID